ncbi:MAG: MmcQ/YjbR family DNA-binding protein [Bacteroidota bacterium]
MNVEEFRIYCLKKPCVTEHFPFDEVTLVFKVCNKMFALTGLDNPEFRVNLKCDPEKAIELREEFESIIPGYHMSKKHWNTVIVDGSFSDDFLREMIDQSFDLIVQGLPKKLRDKLE